MPPHSWHTLVLVTPTVLAHATTVTDDGDGNHGWLTLTAYTFFSLVPPAPSSSLCARRTTAVAPRPIWPASHTPYFFTSCGRCSGCSSYLRASLVPRLKAALAACAASEPTGESPNGSSSEPG